MAEQTAGVAPQRPATLWRHAGFMRLWTGQTISQFGSQFTGLALPIIAATTLDATPAQMGVLSSLSTLPFLLFGIIAGVWVDRWRRKPVLIAGDLSRALVLAAIPVAILTGRLRMPLLYATEFLAGVLTVFFDVAYQAYLPALVDREQLVEGNSKLQATASIAQASGPVVAGYVIRYLGAWLAVVIDAISFLVSALFVAWVRAPEPPPDRARRASMIAEAREGLGVVLGSPLLRSIAGSTSTSNFFSMALWALLVLFATRELGLDAGDLGLAFGAASIASVVAAFGGGAVARRFGIGPAIVGSMFVSGLSLFPIALAPPRSALPLLILGMALGQGAGTVYNIGQVSLRQAITPLHLQGRMNATMRFLVWGTMPLGALLGGALGQAIGLRPAMLVAAIGSLAAFLWVFFSPVRSLERIPEQAE